ncbi:MAG: glycosyltransferase [Chloroflexota bacterium]
MRIAVFHDLPSGGAKRSLHEQLKRLSSEFDLYVYTLDTADSAFCSLHPYVRSHHVFHFTPPRFYRSPLGRLNQFERWRGLRRLDRLAQDIALEIDAMGFDAVFAQPCMWSQAPLVISYLRTPVLYYLHEPPRYLYESSSRLDAGSKSWRAIVDRADPTIRLYRDTARRLDLKATRAAQAVLVNSAYMQDVVASIYKIDSAVCYHGVDTAIFRPRSDVARRGYVLSVGSIQPSKGFDFLIESLGRLSEKVRPSLRLIGNSEIVGERRYLESLAGRWSVDLRIDVGVSQDELVRAYNEAALVVYAPWHEPFGLVPLEAMACGTPLVAVADGGVRESVVDGVTGLLVPRDKQAFAEATQTLLLHSKLRDEYGHQAREHVLCHWTWERSVEQLQIHLRDVAGKRAIVHT